MNFQIVPLNSRGFSKRFQKYLIDNLRASYDVFLFSRNLYYLMVLRLISLIFTRLLIRLIGKCFLIICMSIFCLLTPLLSLTITIAMITILTSLVGTLFLLNIFLFSVRLFLCQMPGVRSKAASVHLV